MNTPFDSAAKWLTPRRIRAHAIMLALCLWSVCAIDYATPGLFDHAGNIKFQDFLQFPIAANLIAQGRATELYNDQVLADGIRSLVGRQTSVYLQYFYGPQVAFAFLPLRQFSFLAQAQIFVALSFIIYFTSVYLLWRACPSLRAHSTLIFLCSAAYPPLFHFFARGQLSAIVLLCFSAAYLAFRNQRDWLAGIALGCLAFKPQFLGRDPARAALSAAMEDLLRRHNFSMRADCFYLFFLRSGSHVSLSGQASPQREPPWCDRTHFLAHPDAFAV